MHFGVPAHIFVRGDKVLYSNIISPLSLYEYKLILESMLLDMGWFFDLRQNVESSLVKESCMKYVYCEKSSASVDCALARSAFAALSESDLETLIAVSMSDRGTHDIQILKNFLLNSDTVKTRHNIRPTEKDIENLLGDYHTWIGKVHVGESVKSVMASNPRIKFCLIRAFIRTPGFDNYTLLQSNPHVVDLIYSDYIEYCRTNTSIMPDTDTALGHEGENYIDLVGTLVFGMNFFIRQWARNQLPKYIMKDTGRGSGEDGYDLLDAQYKFDADGYDFNVGKSLRQLASVNECVLWNKRMQRPFYSIISWYQTLYIGRKTLELTDMLKRFLDDRFDLIYLREGAYDDRTFEDLFGEVIFNISRSSCMIGGVKSSLSRKVIFLPSFGSSNEWMDTSQHFIDRMRRCLNNLEYVYRNRDGISVGNLYVDSWRMNSTEKTNTEYTSQGLRNSEYDKILQQFKKRYQLDFIPTNAAIHDYATMIFGVNEVKRLAENLEMVGLSIMDVPLEKDVTVQAFAGISDITSMLVSRGINSWKLSKKYRLSGEAGLRQIMLLTDAEILSTVQATRHDELIMRNISEESGSDNILSLNVSNNIDVSQRAEIVGKQMSVLQMKMDQPIYEANTTGRAKFIAQHDVRIFKIKQSIYDKILKSKLWASEFKFSLLSRGFIDGLKPAVESDIVDVALSKKIDRLLQQIEDMDHQGLISEEANKQLSEARDSLSTRILSRLNAAMSPILNMELYGNRSIFCDNSGMPDSKYVASMVLQNTSSFESVCYLVGLCMVVAIQTGTTTLNAEVRKILKAANIEQSELDEYISKCTDALSSAARSSLTYNSGYLSKRSISNDHGREATAKVNVIIADFVKMQNLLVEFGHNLLKKCSGFITVGSSACYLSETGDRIAMSAKRMEMCSRYSFVKVGEGIGRIHYDRLQAGKTMRPGSDRVSVLSSSNGLQVLNLGENEYIIDGTTWLYPFMGKTFDGPPISIQNSSQEFEIYVFRDRPEAEQRTIGVGVIDLYNLLTVTVQLGMLADIRSAFGSCSIVKDSISEINGLKDMTAVVNILLRCTDKLDVMISNYNTVIDTFNEYGQICKLAREGHITQDKFRKNQIEIAAYSDIYQMQIIRSEGDIRDIKDFITQLRYMSDTLHNHRPTEMYKEFRAIGVDFAIPVNDSSSVSGIYDLCIKYCSSLMTDEVLANVNRILDAIATMRALLGGLFKLQRVGAQQSRDNWRRFNQCKSLLLRYMDTPEYTYAAIGADRGSEVMRRLRERFDVDKSTGVFYISDRQQYFLARAEDPQSLDYSKYNVLCNTDGMLLVYDEKHQRFYRQLLSTVTSEIIQAILRQ